MKQNGNNEVVTASPGKISPPLMLSHRGSVTWSVHIQFTGPSKGGRGREDSVRGKEIAKGREVERGRGDSRR